jgi:hypothetical protein
MCPPLVWLHYSYIAILQYCNIAMLQYLVDCLRDDRRLAHDMDGVRGQLFLNTPRAAQRSPTTSARCTFCSNTRLWRTPPQP